MQLGPHTQLEQVKESTLHLIVGQMRIQEKGRKLAVQTDQIDIQPIGTDFEVYHLNGLSRVHLNSGSLKVRQHSDGKIFLLTRQQPEWPYILIHPKLPVRLKEEEVDTLFQLVAAKPGIEIDVDLEANQVRAGSLCFGFEIDEFRRYCLLNGLDAIGLTLQHEAAISAFEAKQPSWI